MIRLREKHSVDVERRDVAMCVAHEDNVDARDFFRDCDRFVFVWNLSGTHFAGAQILAETHVHRNDNYVCALLVAQNRNPLASFCDRLMKFETSVVWRIVPVRNAGRR